MVDARDSAIPWDYFYCNLSRILLDYLLTIRFCCCYYHCLISKILFFWKERGSFQIYKKIIIIFVSTEDHNRWRFLFCEGTEDHNRTTSIHPSIACRVLQPHPTMTEMLLMTVIIGMCTSYCSAYCVVEVVVAKYWIRWEHHTNITDYNHNQIWDCRQVISYAKPKPKWHLMRRALAVASVSMVLHIPSMSCHHHHHHIQWYYLHYNNLINEVRKSQ